MTAEERLALVRLKIERANQHIQLFQAAKKDFFSSNPYKIATKRDLDTKRLIYFLESVSPTPNEFSLIVGDAIQNLRSALDHLAQQLYLVGTGADAFNDNIGFLIAQSAKKFRDGLARKTNGMKQDAIELICALEPFANGKGQDLWTLHRLNNIDKHRLIVTVGSAFNSMDIGPVLHKLMNEQLRELTNQPDLMAPLQELFVIPSDTLFPLAEGKELFIDGPDAEQNDQIQFRFNIVLHEPGVIEGKPALETLVQFRDRVTEVVDGFIGCLK